MLAPLDRKLPASNLHRALASPTLAGMGSTRFSFRMTLEAFESLDPAAARALAGQQVPVRWGDAEAGALIEGARADGSDVIITMLIDEEMPGPDEMIVPCCAQGACCCLAGLTGEPCGCTHLSREQSAAPAAGTSRRTADPGPGPA